jgi:hypothetical protein
MSHPAELIGSNVKLNDSTRVYAGASVGGGWAWDDGSEYHVKGGARGLKTINKKGLAAALREAAAPKSVY